MDIIGTYTKSFFDSNKIPGVTISPPYLQKHRTGQPGKLKNVDIDMYTK